MPKKKVLILGKLPPPYMGPAIATAIILNSSLRESFELIHLNTRVNASLSSIGRWSTGKIFRSYALYLKMAGMLIRKKPDLVLIPFSQDTVPFIKDSIYILLAKLFGRKTLLHLRGSNFLGWLGKSSSLTKWYVKNIVRSADGVIVLGTNLRFLFDGLQPQEKIFVVPNGADFVFPARTDASLSILYFANLFRAKGIEDMLEAVRIVNERGLKNFKVNVVGDWLEKDTKGRCEALVNDKNLPVIFHPPASGEKKMTFFSNADIFVFTPRDPEGHPWVIVEAMAAGLPVIATDKGAIIESVQQGKNGFIVKDHSPEEIADALEKLLKDESLRKNMGIAGRQLYEEKFTENKMAASLQQVFTKVIQG